MLLALDQEVGPGAEDTRDFARLVAPGPILAFARTTLRDELQGRYYPRSEDASTGDRGSLMSRLQFWSLALTANLSAFASSSIGVVNRAQRLDTPVPAAQMQGPMSPTPAEGARRPPCNTMERGLSKVPAAQAVPNPLIRSSR